MKLLRIIQLLLILAILATATILVTRLTSSPPPDRTDIRPALISRLKSISQLCTTQIREDVPVRARIGQRHMFSRITMNADITFDLDKMQLREHADTIFATLPPEQVEILESTAPGSYTVIDTWNDSPLHSSHFTTAEENIIKAKAAAGFRRRIYARGLIRRARTEAIRDISSMLAAVTGKTIIVNDPSPEGYKIDSANENQLLRPRNRGRQSFILGISRAE